MFLYRNRVIIDYLAAKGHDLTILTPNIPDSNAPIKSNVQYVLLENMYDTLYNNTNSGGNDILKRSKENPFQAILSAYNFGYLGCEGAITSKGFIKLLDHSKTYDLIIHDFTSGPCLLPFLHQFNYPKIIGVSPFNSPHFIPELIGGHTHWAYNPHFTLPYTHNMNFAERTINFAVHFFDAIYRKYIYIPEIDQMVRKKINLDFPYLGNLERNYSLLLINSHDLIDGPSVLSSNVIQVAGLQIKKPKPIPYDLLEFIENSTLGTILFSLGTNIKANVLTTEKQQMFIDAFSKFSDYHFIWKLDNFTLCKMVPQNVMVQQWLPQNDILGKFP